MEKSAVSEAEKNADRHRKIKEYEIMKVKETMTLKKTSNKTL
jgi:hypothetical protein